VSRNGAPASPAARRRAAPALRNTLRLPIVHRRARLASPAAPCSPSGAVPASRRPCARTARFNDAEVPRLCEVSAVGTRPQRIAVVLPVLPVVVEDSEFSTGDDGLAGRAPPVSIGRHGDGAPHGRSGTSARLAPHAGAARLAVVRCWTAASPGGRRRPHGVPSNAPTASASIWLPSRALSATRDPRMDRLPAAWAG
jgi:hypothetical protein